MDLGRYLLPLLGGAMMGVALAYLIAMLSGTGRNNETDEPPTNARSQLVGSFAMGTLIGAFAVARLVHAARHGSLVAVMVGAALGALLAYLFVATRMRLR
jgi:hypothetical protein